MTAHRVPADAGRPVLLAAAAANNAAWCHAVCRAHGLATTTADDAWTSAVRTPPLYPDAVTLVPDASIPSVLERVDASVGCSIKDSFASLDLAPFAFEVLFSAIWIARAPVVDEAGEVVAGETVLVDGPVSDWTIVDDADGFARWEQAWRRDDDPADVLRATLLDDPSIVVAALLGGAGDRVLAGAILNDAAGVVGISNLFVSLDAAGAGSSAWAGCLALAEWRFPGATLVGYESGPTLDVARAQGFRPLGPLRVWCRAPDAPS